MAVEVSRQYEFGDFELQPDKCSLKRNGERLRLPQLPFQVLLYLIENRERYVSRQELLDRFWSGSDGYEETLTKCISTIRTQLDDRSAAPKFIETRKKVGYRFVGAVEELRDQPEISSWEIERVRGVKIVMEDDVEQPALPAQAEPQLLTGNAAPAAGAFEAVAPTAIGRAQIGRSKIVSRATLLTLLAFVIMLVTGGVWLYRHRASAALAPHPPIQSIAVLPLENLSGDPAQEYFADGMTDALISNLAQIHAFKTVISRTSVMSYKGNRTKSLPEIAKELNVDAVIEGTVQRSGGRVHVSARLISAAADSPMWSRDYDRDESDVLKLESDVARAITDEIRIQVTADERARLASARSINPQAQEAYLLGRHHLSKGNEEDSKQSAEYFERAIRLAPDYAAAYAELSDAWTQLGFALGNFKEVESKARSAAVKAIELDEQLAEAHIALANIKLYYDLDWTTAEREFKRALDLNPGSPDAHVSYGLLLTSLGRHNEAIREGQIAVQLDPLSSGASVLGRFLLRARRYQEALPYLQRGVELEPRSARAYFRLGDNYVQLGKYDEALAAYEKAGELVPKSGWSQSGIAYVYALLGRQREARQMIRGLKTDPIAIARVYVALGDKDEAFRALNKAIEERPIGFYINQDPAFERLYSDPRWQALLGRMNLPT
jgi:TolB-like protein/DNA-binding winged helix-turn-helix (wHTH) protein/Tfp pilus assembly protein PilF